LVDMKRHVTVSVKVPAELKESMDAYGVETSKVLRKALEDEVTRRKVEELKKEGAKMKGLFAKIPIEDVVKSIRDDRDHR
jgi:antitoxin CcdA